MKHYLITLLFLCNYCIGQIPNNEKPMDGKRLYNILKMMQDSGLSTWISKDLVLDTAYKNVFRKNTDPYGIDTIKVIFQYSDTSREYSIFPYVDLTEATIDTTTIYGGYIGAKLKSDSAFIGYDNNMYWAKGYKVLEYSWGHWWDNTYYLDENKKPLPQNIIVWQSKNILGWEPINKK